MTGPCHEQGSGDEGGLRGMGNDIRVIRDQRHVGPVTAQEVREAAADETIRQACPRGEPPPFREVADPLSPP